MSNKLKEKVIEKTKIKLSDDVKGITLITLVITILVLLVLSGVTIISVTGENGIVRKIDEAKEEAKIADIIEKIELNNIDEKFDFGEVEESNSYKLWKSPFHYQLIGSIYQEEIEKKLGRKLEATDLFYEVNMTESVYGNEEGTYIYNKKDQILINVDKTQLKRNNGVWYWSESTYPEIYQYFIDDQKRSEMLSFLQTEGVTEIYISLGEENFQNNPEFIKKIAREAYEKGMVLEYLVGDPKYILSYEMLEKIERKINLIITYNENCEYNEKIRGIHYDIEIHTSQVIQDENEILEQWQSSNSESAKNSNRRVNYVKFVEMAYNVAKDKCITIAFDVQPLTYSAATVNYNGIELSIMEYVIKNSDYISIMAYKNDVVKLFRYICLPSNTEYDSVTGRLAYTSNTQKYSDETTRNTAIVHELALKYKRNIMIGIEIGEAGEEDAFYDLGKVEMKRILNEFSNLLSKKDSDIVIGEYSLKTRAVEKCGYTNIDFDNYGFIFHKHTEYMTMPE